MAAEFAICLARPLLRLLSGLRPERTSGRRDRRRLAADLVSALGLDDALSAHVGDWLDHARDHLDDVSCPSDEVRVPGESMAPGPEAILRIPSVRLSARSRSSSRSIDPPVIRSRGFRARSGPSAV